MRRVQLAGLACRFARRGRFNDLADNDFGFLRVDFEPVLQSLVDDVFDDRPYFRGNKLVLGLRRELRIGHLAGKNGGQALTAIVACECNLFLARGPGGFRVLSDLTRQRATESGEMRAPVVLRNVVGKAEHAFMVAVIPPQRAFDRNAVALGLDHDGARDKRGLVAIEKLHEGFDAALVFHFLALFDGVSLVGKDDGDTGIQER